MVKIWIIAVLVVQMVTKIKGAKELTIRVEDVMQFELEDLLHEFMSAWRNPYHGESGDRGETERDITTDNMKLNVEFGNLEKTDSWSQTDQDIKNGDAKRDSDLPHNPVANYSMLNQNNSPKVALLSNSDITKTVINSTTLFSQNLLKEKSSTNRRSAPNSLYLRKKEPKRCMGSGSASVFSGGNALNYMSFLVTVSTLILNINNNINNNNNNNNNNVNNNVQNSNVNTNLNSNNANQINVMPPGRRRRQVNATEFNRKSRVPRCLRPVSEDMMQVIDLLTEVLMKGPAHY